MPLHDWANETFWSGVHQIWLVELLRDVRSKLPAGYRAYLGSLPYLAVGFRNGDADVKITRSPLEPPPAPRPPHVPRQAGEPEPDAEAAIATITTPDMSLFVEARGFLVAAVELISPGNKDRVEHKTEYAAKYAGYLRQLVNLMLIDVLPRPPRFSFVDQVAEAVGLPTSPPSAPPEAASFRVIAGLPREPAAVEAWRRQMRIGQPLPSLPLPLSETTSVLVDLEGTYMRAAADAYLA